MDIREVLFQWFIIFLIKRQISGGGIKSENMSNTELAEELHKPVIRKFKKEKYTYLL